MRTRHPYDYQEFLERDSTVLKCPVSSQTKRKNEEEEEGNEEDRVAPAREGKAGARASAPSQTRQELVARRAGRAS